jgi:N-acetylmuramoyl-L-alanine amidase
MRNKFRLVVLLASTAFAMVGCQRPSAVPVITRPGPEEQQTVGVSELARLLGLRVAETTPTLVTFKGSGATVMVFKYAGGPVYANGKLVGKVRDIDESGEIYVLRSLVSDIRSVMGGAEPRPSPGVSGAPKLVVIDAGHGGKDPGAISVLGYYEKTVDLAVARKVASLLRQRGVRVEMTRTGDSYPELEDRANIANRLNADLFVSIHADSSPKSSTRGFTIYVANGASEASHRAADALEDSMAETGLTDRGTQTANYRVLVETTGPAVLIELGYLTNRHEAALLRDDAFQDRLAEAIANGIISSLR